MIKLIRSVSPLFFFLAFFLFHPARAEAYIGPGAGFAFVSSFFILFVTFLLAFVTLLTWPVRWVIHSIRGRQARARRRVRRVVVVGLDGQDPDLTEKLMDEGILPSFARLRDQGTFARLRTTFPAVSPVAWSSFQTGCNPGRHRIFDFLVPNRKSYLPELSSAQIGPTTRTFSLGKYKIPIGKPNIQLRRKSQPFWKVLGNHGVFSTIVRVPITFPPEKFNGVLLSAMCVPDLKGSQGTFSYYSSDPGERGKFTGGTQIPVEVWGGVVKSYISGPENSMLRTGGEMRIPFELRIGKNGADAELILEKKRYLLKLREYTPWIQVSFRPGLGIKVRGLCRFYLKETSPHVKLYMTPINMDPDKPALPISHPFTYAIYLAKTQGPYATLGLAEDTWALNERVLDEEAFLRQTFLIHQERERMFFDALEKTPRGAVVCVFDTTDRIQHMFWRYLEEDHPANRGKDVEKYRNTIRELYQEMDSLVGRAMANLNEDTLLMVMSDHGFKAFKRGVNLNSWLYRNGYLTIKDKPTGAEWFQDVDWTTTRAYSLGLGGIYLNLAGREGKGIVQPGEEERAVKRGIIESLRGLYDEKEKVEAVRDVYDCQQIYRGPYVREAPDLIVGFNVGYRASWSCATGVVSDEVFEDNEKSWSGDHCVNPVDVPGVFFCNRKIGVEEPSIMDIGPTVLDLFGVPIPAYCDGKSLIPADGPPKEGRGAEKRFL
jgi:predicted AlkP superfamily phosphohydrolase/phosphomutase